MSSEERERAKPPEEVLKEAGFKVSKKCCARPSCFDYAARKGKRVLFLKFQPNINAFSQEDSRELEVISRTVSGVSLLISKKTREKSLEDDTVYTRYNILAVTPQTFENIMLRNIYPLIQAGPGGYYVEIDATAIRRRRQKLGLSVGEMAEMIGISRRTLYGYERGMAKASVTAAYNLIYTLGIPVAKPLNIFEMARKQRKSFLLKAKRAIARHKLLHKILKKFARCNITTVQKAPFDFVLEVSQEKMRIIGGVETSKEQESDRRVEEILSVSKILNAHPVFITNGRKHSNKDIPYVCCEELSKIKKPEDILYLV